MSGLNRLKSWKYPSILLMGIGISNIGEWIYFLSLNLIILKMTGSPFAVTILYLIKHLATLCTNGWAGSIIDRYNKRQLMVFLDLFRAALIAFLPSISSLLLIYIFVLIINMASSMFGPTSMTYITKLIPAKERKRFNSLHSLVTSGAFLIGPAIVGLLFIVATPAFAIYTNAVAYFLSGIITLFMPDLDHPEKQESSRQRMDMNQLKKDFRLVFDFSHQSRYVTIIYFLFSSVMMIMSTAVDSLEAAFAKEILYLSDSEYGFLVSIAGAGILIGALFNSLLIKRLDVHILIGGGSLLVAVGYLIYAFSGSFPSAAAGFFILAFFIAFANTGFLTFYQTNIPVEIMGRIGSIFSVIQAVFIILTTGLMGVLAHYLTIRIAVIIGVSVMFVLSLILCMVSLLPSKRGLYQMVSYPDKEL